MNSKLEPFLKWAGGKRWFATRYESIFPEDYNRYIEPFVGSGAIFFKLCPNNAILADYNEELISTYLAIKQDWRKVYSELEIHHNNHNEHYYYNIRGTKPIDIYNKAARMIYLNRTCWNGLYRVNMKGEFNVPIGTKTSVITEEDDFEGISKALQNVKLSCSDFEPIIDEASDDDFLFVDPPYTVKHNNNGFIKYNEKLFSWADQVRLRDAVLRAKRRGVRIILTNANNSAIRKLYSSHFCMRTVKRHSILSGKSEFRVMVRELIITG
jgi:DNA adenine methylase